MTPVSDLLMKGILLPGDLYRCIDAAVAGWGRANLNYMKIGFVFLR